jgi:hypothetical protein
VQDEKAVCLDRAPAHFERARHVTISALCLWPRNCASRKRRPDQDFEAINDPRIPKPT